MVSQIDHFDVIVAASEFEALVLECSLIKRHMPKYNILLKDDKGYPYLRVDMRDEYPVMELVNASWETAQAIWTLRRQIDHHDRYHPVTLKLPSGSHATLIRDSAAVGRGRRRKCDALVTVLS